MMDNLIRRQAAIEVVGAIWAVTGDVNVAKAWDQIKDLPSAQPEIVRCKDCKWHDFGKPNMVYCRSLDCFVSEDFFCKDGERSVENGSAIVPPSWTDKSDHS